MKVFAILLIVVFGLGSATQTVASIRDSIGHPSTAMTDGQTGEVHQDTTFEGGVVEALVALDMTQEAPFLFTSWGGVLHGFGTASGPSGPAPSFANTTFDLVWHRTLASLTADPGGHGVLPGFDGFVWTLPMHHTEEFFGATSDPGPRTTVYVAGDSGGQSILIDGGYLIVRPNHSGGEAVLLSTGSTEAIGVGLPPDLQCTEDGGSGPSCSVLPRRHAWMIAGTLVEEVPTLPWYGALGLWLVLMILAASWRAPATRTGR